MNHVRYIAAWIFVLLVKTSAACAIGLGFYLTYQTNDISWQCLSLTILAQLVLWSILIGDDMQKLKNNCTSCDDCEDEEDIDKK